MAFIRRTHFDQTGGNPLTCRIGTSMVAVSALLWASLNVWADPTEVSGNPDGEKKEGVAESRRKQRDESVKVMLERARQTKVAVIRDAGEPQAAELNPRPLLYFTNEPHRIIGGSLWGWSVGGRPVALCKVEQYDRGRPDQTWLYCLTSLSDVRIHAQWRDGESWSAKTSGVEVHEFSDAPAAQGDERRRLAQMKDLSRRFSARDFEPNGPGSTEFRLLTQPLWRYSSPEQGIVDGAVFVTDGAVYLIELHQGRDKKLRWRYAVKAMSAWAVSIKLDEKEIWSKPFTAGPAPYDDWIFRWELPVDAGK